MSDKDKIRIGHMLVMAQKALSLVKDREKDDLYIDETFSMALLYILIIIGEAAAGISHDFKEKYGSIPWRKIISMRNWLIHGYFKTELGIV